MRFIRVCLKLLYYIEVYFHVKTKSERWILFCLVGLSVAVLLWVFAIPALENYARHLQHLSALKQLHIQNEILRTSNIRQYQNQQAALNILHETVERTHIQLQYAKQLWQDILGEISQHILQIDDIAKTLHASKHDNILILQGRADWINVLQLINLLERSVPFLYISYVEYNEQKDNFNYKLHIQDPFHHYDFEKDVNMLLSFLNTPDVLDIFRDVMEIPQSDVRVSMDMMPIVSIQAFTAQQAKINGEWFLRGEKKHNIHFIDIAECGVVLELLGIKNCFTVDIKGKE